MHPAPEVVESVLGKVTMALRSHKGPALHVFVGHDFGLLLIREFLFGGEFEELPWIGNLDGFVLLMESQNTVRGLWWSQGIVSARLGILDALMGGIPYGRPQNETHNARIGEADP
jgi:hypothetical protein